LNRSTIWSLGTLAGKRTESAKETSMGLPQHLHGVGNDLELARRRQNPNPSRASRESKGMTAGSFLKVNEMWN